MKVLFVGLRWDYKDPDRGPSFEFTNIWDSLRRMPGIDAELFAVDHLEARLGREHMNHALVETVAREQPGLVFFFLFEDELFPTTVEEISKRHITLNWFADDHWRFESFSRHWGRRFTWVATTDGQAVKRYRSIGCENVLRTQWGCNHHVYRPLDFTQDLDVTFVGQPHGSRGAIVDRMRSKGVDVRTWGHGWPEGRVDQRELVEIFNRSKVNLNLSNVSVSELPTFVRRLAAEVVRARLHPARMVRAINALASTRRQQLKGRNFEVPGCGAFLLTNDVPDLSDYYVPGREVATFDGVDDLVDKARYFLDNDGQSGSCGSPH